jgi:hypothetical protein
LQKKKHSIFFKKKSKIVIILIKTQIIQVKIKKMPLNKKLKIIKKIYKFQTINTYSVFFHKLKSKINQNIVNKIKKYTKKMVLI